MKSNALSFPMSDVSDVSDRVAEVRCSVAQLDEWQPAFQGGKDAMDRDSNWDITLLLLSKYIRLCGVPEKEVWVWGKSLA